MILGIKFSTVRVDVVNVVNIVDAMPSHCLGKALSTNIALTVSGKSILCVANLCMRDKNCEIEVDGSSDASNFQFMTFIKSTKIKAVPGVPYNVFKRAHTSRAVWYSLTIACKLGTSRKVR